MNQQLLYDISKYVEDHIGEFHAARIAKLQNMNLKGILKRKNPYMYKMLNKFVREFVNEYCNEENEIEWDKIVCLNAAIKPSK